MPGAELVQAAVLGQPPLQVRDEGGAVTPIPRNVRLAEAPSFGKPILLYDVQSVGAKSYLSVAQELMQRVEIVPVTESPEPQPEVTT